MKPSKPPIGSGFRFALYVAVLCLLLVACSDEPSSIAEPTEDPEDPDPPIENETPVIAAQRDTSVVLGDTLELRAIAFDSDGDSLSFRLTAVLSWPEIVMGHIPDATLDRKSGHFRFIPVREDGHLRAFKFHVQDAHGGEDSTRFMVEVEAP